MDGARRLALSLQLHNDLMGQINSVARICLLVTGRQLSTTDLVRLLNRMESDLAQEIARIGTEPSQYNMAELGIRRDIAVQVVSNIRRGLHPHSRA